MTRYGPSPEAPQRLGAFRIDGVGSPFATLARHFRQSSSDIQP